MLKQKIPAEGHTSVVGDVAWHQHNPKLLGSVGDDKQLLFWDTSTDGSKPTITVPEVSLPAVQLLCLSELDEDTDFGYVILSV